MAVHHVIRATYTEVSNFYALLETISFTYFVPRMAIFQTEFRLLSLF